MQLAVQATKPQMTLEERVGQVILAAWTGDRERLAGTVAKGRLGGVVLPGALLAAEAATVANRLQHLAPYPILCAREPAPSLPDEAALGAARRPDLAQRAGALAGARARAAGVHLVLGPSLDVQREPEAGLAWRSFGENPSLVAHLGSAFVEGCLSAGALAVAGRFPGGGSAVYDAGRSLASLPQDRLALEKIDLLPYVEAGRAGLGAVMSGHLHVKALDSLPNRLATHSSAVVEGLLRGTLQFGGLLLSDSLDAPEIRARYSPGQAAVLAFAAGHDLLVTESPEEVYRALYEVLLHGDIPAARLEEALDRIWAAKRWLRLLEERFVEAPSPGEPEAQALSREVARAALTSVRGQSELLAGRRTLVLAGRAMRPDGSAVDADLVDLTGKQLAAAACRVLDPPEDPSQLDGALTAAAAAQASLLFVDQPRGEEGARGEALAALAQALKRAGQPVGVVVMGDPQALARYAAADLLIWLPGNGRSFLEAAFAYLLGQSEAPGRLPVTVRGLGG